MGWSYKPLWRLLLGRDMKKTGMQRLAGISSVVLAKMGKNQPVTLETLGKICKVLECRVEDVIEYIPET